MRGEPERGGDTLEITSGMRRRVFSCGLGKVDTLQQVRRGNRRPPTFSLSLPSPPAIFLFFSISRTVYEVPSGVMLMLLSRSCFAYRDKIFLSLILVFFLITDIVG